MASVSMNRWPEGARLTCLEVDCMHPKGLREQGLSKQGLKTHYARAHSGVTIDWAAYNRQVDNVLFVKGDLGTPGDEVVMGPAMSFMDDVRHVLDPRNESVPVELSPNDGVRVKARNGVLYVDGQPADLQTFISGLTLALRLT